MIRIEPCDVRKDFIVKKTFGYVHSNQHHNHHFCDAGDMTNDTEDIAILPINRLKYAKQILTSSEFN